MKSAPLRDRFGDILIACADVAYGHTVGHFLSTEHARTERCHDAAGVLRLVGRHPFDVIILDLDLNQDSDVDLVSFIREQNPAARLILLFDIYEMDRALEGVRQGAFFYLPKSSPPSDVALVVTKARQVHALATTADRYEQGMVEELAGNSPAMQRVIRLLQKVAPTDGTVLLLGESGTGKEVLANAVHRLSARKDKPFVAINCAALPEALLESEMFGHVKGAFTGANQDKVGLFEEANGGTIFLDEIGDMAPITQAKLLRVLQNGEIRRVGASTSTRVNVRIIAATNRDLVTAVEENRFREDLYFRLNVVQIRIPPLRERMEALPSLIQHFIKLANSRYGKQVSGLDDQTKSLLAHYEFPGNVRELETIIAHAVIMADGPHIHAVDLPDQVQFGIKPRLRIAHQAERSVMTLVELEKNHIQTTLESLKGNQTKAAKLLGISRSTLWRKMKEYGLEG
ncbi:MAG: sigma-54-dependent Fis family transcriptional regulator [Candidatus Hydrogenedentes bacterium]|nr:sigma-54-dependent Fis family transcriptional regulator [Candidatus Hydrogenedentota bacterium]